MTSVEIKEIKKEDYNLWDELVERSPQGTIFHNSDWLKIVERHTNSKLYLFAGYLGGEPVAAIPFFYHRKYFFKILSSPIPGNMIQNLGPIIPNYDDLKQDKKEFYFREFQKELNKYIHSKIKPHLTLIITSPDLIDARPYIWTNYQVIPKYNYIKNIENLDLVWNGFKRQLRKNIVNAEKNGVEIEEGDSNSYNIIVQSLSGRLEEQELKFPVSKEYMLDLYQTFNPNNLKVFIAKYEEKQVGGIIVTAYKDKISIWVGATRANLKGLYPIDLLQWKIIEWGNENGYKYCEILGANIPSISYFKSRYNFDLDIYYSIEKSSTKFKVIKNTYIVAANAYKILRHPTSRSANQMRV
jgi:hypothetical protein